MQQPRCATPMLALSFVLAIASASACQQGARPTDKVSEPGDVALLLKRQTQELMDAVAPGETEVWRRYLLDDVVYLDENGVVHDKASLLKELKPLPTGLVGRIEVDRFQLTLHGDAAVVAAELQEHLDYHGQNLRTRFRFLDTWLLTPDGWRLAARHTAAVLKDPPAIALPAKDLCAYSGVYQLTSAILTTVRCAANGLVAERTGRPPETLLPEVRDVFFVAGKPRSRWIFNREGGVVIGFVERREGEDIRWKKVGGSSAITEFDHPERRPRRARDHPPKLRRTSEPSRGIQAGWRGPSRSISTAALAELAIASATAIHSTSR